MPPTASRLLARLHALERRRSYSPRRRAPQAAVVEREAAAAGLTALALRASLVRADVLCSQGRHEAALGIVQHAALESERLDDPELEARIHFTRYLLHAEAGDLPEARWHARRSVDALPQDAPPWLRAEHLLAITVAADPSDEALDAVFDELLQLARREQDHRIELFTLNNLAWTAADLGRTAQAVAAAERMRRVSSSHAVPLRSPDLDTIAAVELLDGRPEEALRTVELALAPGAGGEVLPVHRVVAHLTAARVLQALERPGEAGDQLHLAVRTATRHRLTGLLAEAELARADLHAGRGEWEAAYRAHVRHHAAVEALRTLQVATRSLLAQVEHESRATRRDRDRYRDLAHTDPLTGLPNRRAAQGHLEAALAEVGCGAGPRADRRGLAEVTVGILDVDRFKDVNDTFSHEVGDLVLQGLAEVLTAARREDPSMFCARLGGEEFLLAWTGSPADATASAELLRGRIAGRTWPELPAGRRITASTGTASTAEGLTSFSELLSSADARLYVAKRGGRDRVVTAAG